jgi:hypothetical protein
MSQPNFVTCLCQNCSGHIKFDASQLRKGEIRRAECPHCHLETILYIPAAGKNSPNPEQLKSSKSELTLFEFTRFVTLVGAALVFFALIITGFLVVKTLLPEKPETIQTVNYETVAPVVETAPQNQNLFTPSGPKVASEGTFPQPVVDFLIKHQGFSLKEWLQQLKPEHKKPFLDNLATVIQTGNSKKLTSKQSEQLVKDYAESWISLNEKAPNPNAAMEKQIYRASCISAAFGLFIALTILCLILVLLAIERNTRFGGHEG